MTVEIISYSITISWYLNAKLLDLQSDILPTALLSLAFAYLSHNINNSIFILTLKAADHIVFFFCAFFFFKKKKKSLDILCEQSSKQTKAGDSKEKLRLILSEK